MKKILIIFISLFSCVNMLAEKTNGVCFHVTYKNGFDCYYSGNHYMTNYTYGTCNGVWYVKDSSYFKSNAEGSREDYDKIVKSINEYNSSAITSYDKYDNGQTIWFNSEVVDKIH